jgi:hypothetical protein
MPAYRNEGPQQFVFELGRDVAHGEEFKGSAALAANHGFVLIEKKADKPAKDEE